jgi:hypothetical protein
MTAQPRPRTEQAWRRPAWPPAVEEKIRKLLAQAPPLGPEQKERLARLLDLGGGHDG